ncbi:MAG: hypothetical protein QXJ16_02820 [Desulfurococcaceae archaeon]
MKNSVYSLKVLVPALAILIVVAAVGEYLAGYYTGRPTAVVEYKPPERIKAAWIYVGPVGDMGWSYMRNIGRRFVADLFKNWLETTY